MSEIQERLHLSSFNAGITYGNICVTNPANIDVGKDVIRQIWAIDKETFVHNFRSLDWRRVT